MKKLAEGTLFGRVHDFLTIHLPKQRRVSPNTIKSYRKALEQLFDFVKELRDIPLCDVEFDMLTADAITAFLDDIESGRGCGISTRNQRLAAIKAFINYASTMDIAVTANLKELKKVPKKKPAAVTTIEYMSEPAISAILEQPDVSKPRGFRDRFFMILMYDTGARLQEVINLNLCDFRLGKTPTVTLHGKRDKIRTVPIMEKTVEHLKQYCSLFHQDADDQSDETLFYAVAHGTRNPLSDDCIQKFIKRYGKTARLICPEVLENVHPHQFRHSRAMHLYQHGMDLTLISQWLGHANLETTLIYAHADTEHKRRAIAKATTPDDPLSGKLNPARFTVTDDVTLKRLYGLL